MIHTNQRRSINRGNKGQSGANTQTHAMSFPTINKLCCKSLALSLLLYGCENWTLTADMERRIHSFENKCYRRILVYHIESIKQTNMWDNRSLSSPDVRIFYWQPSSVAFYHGSATSVVMIYRRRSYILDRPVDVVIAAHRERHRSMGSHCNRCICRSTPTTPGRHGY